MVMDVAKHLDISAWQQHSACQGDDGRDFYPPTNGERKRERAARQQRAKSICAGCPVISQCLDHALSTGERYGVWGGLTADERSLSTSAQTLRSA